jgi:hypothetical protein
MSYPHFFYFLVLGGSRRKDAPDEVRKLCYQILLARSNNGRLGKRVTREVASQFGLHIRTVQKIWKRGKQSLAQGIVPIVQEVNYWYIHATIFHISSILILTILFHN